MIEDFARAVSFLTRFPVPGAAAVDVAAMGRATRFFPAVGVLLALLQGLVLWWAMALFHSSWLAAVLAVVALTVATGAMHLDGLADSADGIGGGRTAADALRIMRDPTVGAFGVTAVVSALVLRIVATSVLFGSESWLASLVAISAISRTMALWLGWALPYARTGVGLGRVVTETAGIRELAFASATAVGITGVVVGPWHAAVLVLVAVAVTVTMAGLCRRRLGGVTGDTLGATTELCELSGLLVACAWAVA